MKTEMRSKRFERLRQRDINKEVFVSEMPELGLIVMDSPGDPKPSLEIRDGRIVEMDGRAEAEFDAIDRFIAKHGINLAHAPEAMAMGSLEIARMLVDIHVPQRQVMQVFSGLSPAMIAEVMSHLNVVEMMMAMQKMRQRKRPADQAHVTNWKENPALVAADAAEAGLRGFAEGETTVRVARMAPFSALALLVGAQVGRPGMMTQISCEEALNLRLAMKGLATYAETLSVYGTIPSFLDGDDTPWSKGILASAYASRGVKSRFTSGSGSEALMGYGMGFSMLYLEIRCLLMVKGAGSQGVQNGSISCIALPESLPNGVRGVMAENLVAAALGLEVASGNDAMSSHSQMRKTAKLMLQMLPGTDFVTSGHSVMPRKDNLFGGGNFDAEDMDDWLVIQRDMQVDTGLKPVREAEVLAVRRRAASAIQAVFREMGFPAITEAEVEAATTAFCSDDMPDRDSIADLAAADAFLESDLTALDVVAALARSGFEEVAENVLEMQRQRVLGDYLHTSAVFDQEFNVQSAVNTPNDYRGPGTGYRVEGKVWDDIRALPQAIDPHALVEGEAPDPGLDLAPLDRATAGDGAEVVVALGPAFASVMNKTLAGLSHADVLRAVLDGIEGEGVPWRVFKVWHGADLADIGLSGARLCGSGIGIGLQSKGTALIHKKGLAPLNNLELLSMAPNLTLESYRALGRNAACYATGRAPAPVPMKVDNMARLRLIVHTTLLHHREVRQIDKARGVEEMKVTFR
ncbi:propanediol/glycerol family dehydratase large subunit [Thalassorhabdomicrobium marinisediminis]|uniref:propanediol/glycerol family dehydratase large subunit n=1 Tax=Thalassorhabdomicrobium marinisediminis TaxID=2170577 RepID=UPI002492B04B|nr:propanediol/glycerol family dehydratase large subunit [Thalassorhabdomicrobium marinisediminis]